MPINVISLITGALSISAALAWNKAVNDMFQFTTKNVNTSFIQAILITILIMIVVTITNIGINVYTRYKKTSLSPYIIKAGTNNKITLW